MVKQGGEFTATKQQNSEETERNAVQQVTSNCKRSKERAGVSAMRAERLTEVDTRLVLSLDAHAERSG